MDPNENKHGDYLSAHLEGERVVRLVVFGRGVSVGFETSQQAQEFADKWDKHMAASWKEVLQTPLNVVGRFREKLAGHGVPQLTLDAAMGEIQIEEDGQ